MGKKHELTLFGGDEGWNTSDWTASDDRVRGGKSQSYLDTSNTSARFHGNLDIKTLGGAGFASQRTTTEDKTWDLSDYDGIRLDLGKSDGKRYTFILKDELLPRNPGNGREQATTSYEYDFDLSEEGKVLSESSFVFVKWDQFKPTYRGKEKKDASKLDKKNVKRLSIMMRSFFGDQQGDFSLTIKSIKAISIPDDEEIGFEEKDEPNEISSQNEIRWLDLSSVVFMLGVGVVTFAICCVVLPTLTGRHMKSILPWERSFSHK
ncbi:CIA30 family protein [Dendryphion nanum]|uniref:CIA30 family protein n=1 Tax=Dendryphion nanum TaxID=256645 RepID=A0A9P9D8M9_9PLEO|nr:CIA30 family protein [Dendryphion nanum]